MARVTAKYFDDVPPQTKGMRRWLRRFVHRQAAAVIDLEDRFARVDQVRWIERAVDMAMEYPDQLAGWKDEDEYRGRGYNCGKWVLRANFVAEIRKVVNEAAVQIDTEYSCLDSWLRDFDEGLMFGPGVSEPAAATVFPGGQLAWEEVRMNRRWRCRRKGCSNLIDWNRRGAHIRKFCDTCRPSRSAKPRKSGPEVSHA